VARAWAIASEGGVSKSSSVFFTGGKFQQKAAGPATTEANTQIPAGTPWRPADTTRIRTMARPKLIIACPETNADLLYATQFRAPDAFAYVEIDGKKHILLNDLEVDRGRASAKVDVVDAYSEFSKLAAKTPEKAPSFSKVIATWLTSKNISEAKVPRDFPFGLAKDLKKAGIDLKPARGSFYPEREIKNRNEIHCVENAIRIAEAGMARGIEVLRSSRILKDGILSFNGSHLTSESLRVEIETALIQNGGEARGDTIVACGNEACDPHARGSGPLRANELIILDIFPRDARSGWFGDITRTVVRGKASDAQRHLWETCLNGQKLALDAIKPGLPGGPIHDLVKKFFADQGYPTEIKNGRWQGFFHGTGHGLGLEVHESPRFADTTFQPGQVLTVEPGIYIPGLGGVRHEDVVLITKTGVRLLTQFAKPFEI
jgi:Xaa-Pro aminopeptidase